jgi:hypothetical protein
VKEIEGKTKNMWKSNHIDIKCAPFAHRKIYEQHLELITATGISSSENH